MSSDSSGTEQGTLIVWVPHWSATVRLLDNEYTPIATLSPQTDGDQGRYPVQFHLAPGVYSVEVELSGATDSEWVSVRAKKETVVPVERWATLQPLTPTPLGVSPSSGSQAPTTWAGEAERWSRETTWPSSRPGPARLFVFVQTPDPAKYVDFASGLTLLDAALVPIVDIEVPQAQMDPKAGWLAFSTDLAPGFYTLARKGPGPFRYQLPLYFCDGWETQLFLAGGNGPSFRSLTIHMAPLGHGFRRDDEIAGAAEAVMAALRSETSVATVVTSSHLKRLLYSEHRNPWLAVLAAYAMTLDEQENRRPGERGTVLLDPSLKQEILQFLHATIGSHPDVRALLLDQQAPAPEPFPFPPLVRIGLQRVQRHATRFASTVPLNSLTERMFSQLITSSPWSVWAEPIPEAAAKTTAPPGGERDVVSDVKRRIRRGVTRVAGLGASAPVFRSSMKAQSAKTATTELREAFYGLPVFRAAQQMIGADTESTLEKIVVNTTEAADKLLSGIQPEALSSMAGIPLSRAEHSLKELKAKIGKGAPTFTKGNATERAILQYALRKGATGSWAKSGEAEPPAGGPAPAGHSLEEGVSALRNAAALLSGKGTPPPGASTESGTEPAWTASESIRIDPALTTRAEGLATRLTALADALLRRADLVVLTDANGKFLYANGAFTLLVTEVSGATSLETLCKKWSEWLHSLPLGRSTGLTSPADPEARVWTVRRVAVEDQGSRQRTSFVNILEDERRSPLPEAATDLLVSLISSVTLNASFFRYGSAKRLAASLEALEGIAGRLESAVSSTSSTSSSR